jgi:hypothetical protein
VKRIDLGRGHLGGWVSWWGVLLGWAVGAASALDEPVQAPARRFMERVGPMDAVLERPYGPEVPLGSTGERLWATSPQGWAFGEGVHWLFLSNLRALDLDVRDELGPLAPARATYRPSHVHLEGAVRRLEPSASFTWRTDRLDGPLTRPFRPEKRWTCWSSGRRSDWYAVDFGGRRVVRGVKLWFYDDEGRGACRAPREYRLERWVEGQWQPIELTERSPKVARAGENTVRFDEVETERLRVVFEHQGAEYYTGLYGFEPVYGGDGEEPDARVEITGDKFIAPDDVLVVVLRVRNGSDEVRRFTAVPVPDWEGQYEGRVISNRSQRTEGVHGPWAFWAESRVRQQGYELRQVLRFAVMSEPAQGLDVKENRQITVATARGRDDNAAFLRSALGFTYELQPGETKVVKAAMEIRPVDEPLRIDAYLNPPQAYTRSLEAGVDRLGVMSPERQDQRDVLSAQVQAYQSWFDANLAGFDCSDEWIRKLYYHRAYLLRRNLLEPRLGVMKWPTQSEGRWRSSWYANVISYGAAHQIREARWLADPQYWRGHLRTWAYNAKPDRIYPSHVLPSGPAGGQYTDWISSTGWEGELVHPDRGFLAEVVDRLADNTRGWQEVYDADGDGLLMVDSHWWTGMEYQPSFFFFSDYQTSEGFDQPQQVVPLERVDLTAYNFGNATNVARMYRALGQAEKAKEFEELAAKIAAALAAKMWRPETSYFYSLRASDDAVAEVKEIVGVYPFYFGMVPAGKGYEAAWDAILDPEQFWTPWPVASVSKQCPAYSQTGWPQAGGRAAACMWNGPTWPHANSIVLTAMARTLRADREVPEEARSPLTMERFWELFTSFTKAQYREQDLTYPWTGEFYNGETGEWKTGERDYNHSTWLDILIPEVVGLVPRDDEVLEVDPLVPEGALSWLVLDGQRYRGHDVTIVWDAADDERDVHDDGRSGLDVYLDGKLVASSPTLERLKVDMKTGEPVAESK